jgi:hypothetical protein
MRPTVARPRRAIGALLLLAAATFAFGATVTASAPTAARPATAVGIALRDDARAVAAVPARATEWAVGPQRGSPGNDQLVAVLVAAAVLVPAQARRRAALAARPSRAALRGQRSGIRAPPAFA